jgi:hypothetical protein
LFDDAKTEVAKVWGKQFGKQLTENQLLTLVTEGFLPKVKLKSKSGKEYQADLALQPDFSVKFADQG